ncbi:Linear gramicidin synthase subunit D [Vibrio ruber DSM 16370]|uniref:Linear gramicidin synthase subunit D n=1 Tax=Vibrio ruber (strain DSM 16370 / JCM 11486 / BCRC 17186 / CECT 7878 / LMG 23124 / VR1) TaxID=1123498 RepID=A0A1R4LC88_VIBR1|nr:non-ribosomal peptide synthetase [Vibrio ruber]SJN54191.1 Linear gramicidin synthase subunit D [Vibrio ruber DSM 16370]
MSIAVLLAELFQRDIRLHLENGKLKIDAPKGAFTAEIKQTLQARKAEIIAHLQQQQQSRTWPALTRVNRADAVLPLSFAQERMWFLQQFEQASGQYNVNALLAVKGQVDLTLFRQIFGQLVAEHEIFRTTFSAAADGHPVAHIHTAQAIMDAWQIREIDLGAIEQPQADDEAYDSALKAVMSEPFDLAKPPLFRLTHLKCAAGASRLLLTFHHILVDHWSLQTLTSMMVEKANQLTRQLSSQQDVSSPELFQYIDYAQWQKQLLSGDIYEQLMTYWRNTLEDGDYHLELPMRRPVEAQLVTASEADCGDDEGARYHFSLTEADYQQLKRVCETYRMTPYTVLLAAYQWMLSQRTGQQDIRVACPVAERSLPEFENMLGLFVNTLVIRSQLSTETTTESWLQTVHQALAGAQSHSAMPFEKLVDTLVSTRDISHEPLVQTMFNYLDDASSGQVTLGDMVIESLPVPEFTAKYDLSLFAVHHNQQLGLSFQYRTACYRTEDVAQLAQFYLSALRDLLQCLTDEPTRPLRTMSGLSEAEWQMLWQWNQTEQPAFLPPQLAHATLGEALAGQARKTPQQRALVFTQTTAQGSQQVCWDYQTLNHKVNQLAHWIRKQGVAPESRIAICMPRSAQMVVSLLATVQAGCAYVPVDPEHPPQRLELIVQQAQPTLLLTVPELENFTTEFAGEVPCHTLDDDWSLVAQEATDWQVPNRIEPEHLAYVLFTSGSTGKPKGVAVPHVGVMNRILWMQEQYPLDGTDVVLQKTPYSFDVSVWEFFWPLMVGATLVVAPPEAHKDSQKLVDLIRQHTVTTLHFVPTMLQAFLDHQHVAACTSLRRVFTSGEALSFALKERFFSQFSCQLHNLYGPTEASIDVTYWDCSTPCPAIVPIGYPIANMQTWILNADLNPVPVGVAGELYLSGPGLARGYFGRDDLTEQAFIANPFYEDYKDRRLKTGGRFDEDVYRDTRWYTRLYRTGDLARYREDGSIEYLGRTDFQVKVRGLRIELGEIEAAILALDFVKEVLVTAPDQQTLAAYVVIDGDEPDWARWQTLLAPHLPAYMIPAVFVRLDAMPVNANGKADRKALPEIDLARQNAGEYVAPQSPREVQLAQVFAEVLRLDTVSIEDNFFALGGDSIMSLQVVAKARAHGLAIEPKQVFQYATVKALAAVARVSEQTDFAADTYYGDTQPSAIQHWFLTQNLPNPNQFNQAVLLASTADIQPVLVEQTLAGLLQAHPLLAARFTRNSDGQWIQSIPYPNQITAEQLAFQYLEWQSSAEESLQVRIDQLCQQTQSALSIEEGRLFRAVLVRIVDDATAACSYRLLLVAHHLVIDAVSWRILFETLSQGYSQLAADADGQGGLSLPGQTAQQVLQQGGVFQAQTLPYKGWVAQFAACFGSPATATGLQGQTPEQATDLQGQTVELADEQNTGLNAWQAWTAQPEVQQALQVNYPLATQPLFPQQPIGIAALERFELSQHTTQALFERIAPAVKANGEEVCLTALAHALWQWSGQPNHLIQLEGHGRDQLDLDVSQTLGWFTRIYPALISAAVTPDQSWHQALLSNRAALSHNPERQQAVPFLSIQSQLTELSAAQGQPTLVFNYLGQLDLISTERDGEALFRKAPESLSAFRDEQNPRYWPIEINAFVQQGQLVVNIQYAAQWLSQTEAQRLATLLADSLQSLADSNETATGAIAADYPLAKVNDAQVQVIVRQAERQGMAVDDLYTLSPAQQGMYFHCLDYPDAYISQSVVTCRGALHKMHFQQAWQNAVNRHTALRTCFICDGVDEPHQLVLRPLRGQTPKGQSLQRLQGQSLQGQTPQMPLVFDEYDASSLTESERQQQLHRLQQQAREQLDLEQAPLMRLALVRWPDTADGQADYRLIWTIHHLIMDGWCLQRLVGEVMADYRTLVKSEPLPNIAGSAYRDFIAWLGESERATDAKAYWHSALAGFEQGKSLPAPVADVSVRSTATFHSQSLGESLSASLSNWARTQGVTLNTVIQGLWGLVLSRYLATDDVVYGVTTSGRPADLANADGIMGVFINTLPLRLRIEADATLGDWLTALQAQNLHMRDYEQTPLANIQRYAALSGNGPLFDSLLVFENLPVSDSTPIDGLSLTLDAHHVENNFPLTLRVVPRKNLQFDLLMNPQQVDAALMPGLVSQLIRWIERVTADPQSQQQPLITLIRRWSEAQSSFTAQMTQEALAHASPVQSVSLVQSEHALARIQKQAREATALTFYSDHTSLTQWSYQTLLSQAGQLAQQLPRVNRPEVNGDAPVIAICMPRQMEQIVAMLAVWYQGAAWVCIDPELPFSRIQHIIDDARPAYIIGGEMPSWVSDRGDGRWGVCPRNDSSGDWGVCPHNDTHNDNDAGQVLSHHSCAWIDITALNLGDDVTPSPMSLPPLPQLTAQETAYLVYTSGSTGKPKGVQVSHGNLLSYVDALFERVSLTADATMTTFATVAADLGFTCVLASLCSGRTLRLLPPNDYFDPEALAGRLAQHPVDVLKIAPSHLKALLAVAKPQRLLPQQCLIVGGESLDVTLWTQLRALAPTMTIVNHYGPTETTIGCCATELRSQADLGSIGTPLRNSVAYVVDEAGLPVANGVAGELWIAGAGVASGYLNRPDNTTRQFSRTDVLGLSEPSMALPLYKTGDRVVRGAQGELHYLGRQDDQVKIRGFRVELGEVRATLQAMPDVEDAVVLAVDGPSGQRLAAAVILASQDESQPRRLKQLEIALEGLLPDYMVPRLWQVLTQFPLQKNGKLDRQALASSMVAPDVTSSDEAETAQDSELRCVAPQPDSEPKLSAKAAPDVVLSDLWESLLKIRPQAEDNLFALGADSIICLQFIAKARQHGFKLTPKQIYAAPTVAALTTLLAEQAGESDCATPETAPTESKRTVDVPFGEKASVAEGGVTAASVTEASVAASSPESETPSITETLLSLWSALLRQPVSVSDNFFTLGGDSIIALQLVARARQHGLVITPKMLYATPTIAELAVTLGETAQPAAEPETVAADTPKTSALPDQQPLLPLLPIQQWFLEQPQPYPHYWNQAVMLRVPTRIVHRVMSQAVDVVLHKHPLLTARFEHLDTPQQAGYWLSHETAAVYAGFDGQDPAGLTALVAATQQSLNLTEGPLFKVVAFNLADGSSQLLLVAHHLVVDGVSWRVIGRELHQTYQTLLHGGEVTPDKEETTAAQWQQQLQHLPDEKLTAAGQYWQPMVNRFDSGILIAGAQPGTVGAVDTQHQTFSSQLTARLLGLGNLHQRSACEVAMLGALTQAVQSQFPRDQLLIDMESHGRCPWLADQDLSETVGWLTSRFPVRFDTASEDLDSVARQLAAVPDLGIGYGVLRYLHQRLAFPAPQILFNYLGQTGTLDMDWQLIDGAGQARHPDSLRRQLIEVTAQIRDGVLTVVWQYPPALKSQLDPVADAFAQRLEGIASFAGQTPLAGQSQQQALRGQAPLAEQSQQQTLRGQALLAGQTQQQTLRGQTAQPAAGYALTPVQQGMYLHSSALQGATPDESLYFNQTAVAIEGTLDAEAFVLAWQQTVNREQALRAHFQENQQGEPRQYFAAQVHLPVEILDWSGDATTQQQQRFEALCRADREKGFDLNTPPLMRLTLIRIAEQQHWLIWSRHHLIVDAWCSALVIQDVMCRYRQAMGDTSIQLTPRPDFSLYLDWLTQQDLDASKTFWKNYLRGFETPVALPAGTPDDAFELFDHRLSETLTSAVKSLCRTHGVTLNSVLQAAWALTLSHHSGQHDIVFGMTTSGRPAELPQAQRIIGIFINTIAVRMTLQADQTLAQLLELAHRQGVELREHECLPLVDITAQSELAQNGSLRGQSLFDALLVFENEALGEGAGKTGNHGLSVTPLQAYERNNYPLTLTVMPHDALIMRMGCDGKRVSLQAAKAMLSTLEQVLSAFTTAQGSDMLAEISRQWIASDVGFRGEAVTLDQWHLGAGILSDWTRKRERVAVSGADGQLTYGELLERTLHLVHALRCRGVDSHSRVVVCHARQTDMLVALLGVYAAGASYVPLDPSQPQARLQLILEETSPDLILNDGSVTLGDIGLNHSVASLIAATPFSDADREQALTRLTQQDQGLAYTIFTSGSTGRPKGVQIPRTALSNFLHSMVSVTQITEADKLLAVTTVGFDIAVLELFVPLLVGAQVVIADEAMVRDGAALSACLQKQGISIMQATPMTWQMLMDQPSQNWSHLTALVGGEALPPALAEGMISRGARLLNMYGPTETTVWSSCAEITPDNMVQPPLGRPITNTQLYVLDAWHNPVALGAEGELYIGGDGVSLGYLNRTELTSGVFLPDPFARCADAVMYKTGDRVRLSVDGELFYAGRTDFQIKLRGYRIETGEIEARLGAIEGIREAVVILCYANTEKACLVGYVTVNAAVNQADDVMSSESILSALKRVLPAYMVPQHIVYLAQMPLNANGKIDRKALPEPQLSGVISAQKTAPQTPVEIALAQAWQLLLGTETVYREDDFFTLGGNSLLAGRLVAMLRRQWALTLPLTAVFRHSELQALALHVEAEPTQAVVNKPDNECHADAALLVPMNAQAETNLLTCQARDNVFLLHPAGGIVRAYQAMVQQFGNRFPAYGIESPQLHGLSTSDPLNLEQLAERYVALIRSVQPHGPYRLVGWSFGAWLAMAIAHRLETLNEMVGQVTIIDARADVDKARLQVPELNQVSRYLACLNHRHRTLLLDNHLAELTLLEQTLTGQTLLAGQTAKPDPEPSSGGGLSRLSPQDSQGFEASVPVSASLGIKSSVPASTEAAQGRLSPQEQDLFVFDTLAQLLGETALLDDEAADRTLRLMQMQLLMQSHRLMREHVLQPVAAPLQVFWSSQTLEGSRYQQGADAGEWDRYGQVQSQVFSGDHDTIVRDPRVAEQILTAIKGAAIAVSDDMS